MISCFLYSCATIRKIKNFCLENYMALGKYMSVNCFSLQQTIYVYSLPRDTIFNSNFSIK